MGSKGSGRGPGNDGCKKQSAVSVAGRGVPIKSEGMPFDVGDCWDEIVPQLAGVAFEQDSDAVEEMAWLTWQKRCYREALMTSPLDDELTRLNLAVGRSLSALWSQFGLTPRSRQILVVPDETEELDEFEQMMKERE